MDKENSKGLQVFTRLVKDLPYYSEKVLKIATKQGGEVTGIVPFKFNKAQLYLHSRLEQQKKELGYVRAVILKGRQQGISTYIGARFFHKVATVKNLNTYIITHESAATSNLFDMAKRYYNYLPDAVKPSVSKNNQNQLLFDKLGSGYKLGTAKNAATGRSQTIHLFHGSEVAFWGNNAGEIATGVMSAVADLPGTEVLLESTANGINNYYNTQWRQGENGQGSFISIFIPWYWQEEYRKTPPPGFELTEDELKLKIIYSLDDSQIYWRRNTIARLSVDGTDGEWRFKQEYPMDAEEAFQTSTTNVFIQPHYIKAARKRNVEIDKDAPLIVGVDPARFGDDKTAIIYRRGNVAYGLTFYSGLDNMQVAAKLRDILDNNRDNIYCMYIDLGGGTGIVDRLLEIDGTYKVKGIDFGSGPKNKKKYLKKRSEMWGELREWLLNDVQIPDNDILHGDMAAQTYKYESDRYVQLDPKELIKKTLKRSPDAGDALALTFAGKYVDYKDLI